MSHNSAEKLRALCAILTLERKVTAGLASDTISLARNAGVLELLGARKDLADSFPLARQAFLAQAVLGTVRLQALFAISGALAGQGIDFIPLKGMAYALMFEQGGPVRHMADIDLLVRQQDFDRSTRVLAQLGYQEFHGGPRVGTLLHNERQFARGHVMVELHRAFLPPGRVDIDYDAVWRRSLPLAQEGISCRRLDREDTFLYHCFHFAMHEFAVAGLRHVVELDRLVHEDKPNLEFAASRARQWGICRMTWCALRLYQACLPGRLAQKQLGLFRPDGPVAAVLEKLVIEPSIPVLLHPGPLPRPMQLLRKFIMVDRVLPGVKYFAWYVMAELEGRFRSHESDHHATKT